MSKLAKKSQGPYTVGKPHWRPDGWCIGGPPAIVVATGEEVTLGWWYERKEAEKHCKWLNIGLGRGEIKLMEEK